MTERTLAPERAVVERDDWVAQLERLVADAEVWSEEQDWLVEREAKPISESELGTYTARYRHFREVTVRYARWDLGRVDLVDPRQGKRDARMRHVPLGTSGGTGSSAKNCVTASRRKRNTDWPC